MSRRSPRRANTRPLHPSIRIREGAEPMTVGSAPSAVGPVGLEPTTYGLKVRGSTIELQAHNECTACERLRRSGDCDLAVAFATHSVLRAMPASRGLQLRWAGARFQHGVCRLRVRPAAVRSCVGTRQTIRAFRVACAFSHRWSTQSDSFGGPCERQWRGAKGGCHEQKASPSGAIGRRPDRGH